MERPCATSAHQALQALSAPGVSHLLVTHGTGGAPQGVVADVDVLALCTHERH
jgi:hypothetical protein